MQETILEPPAETAVDLRAKDVGEGSSPADRVAESMALQPTLTEGWLGLEAYRPMLQRWLQRRCRDDSLADDLQQETMIRAARYSRPSGEGRQRAWLLCVAGNLLRDHMRKLQRFPVVGLDKEVTEALAYREPADPPQTGDERFRIGRYDLDQDQARLRLHGALRRLSGVDRALIEAWYATEGCARETARLCGVAQHLVKTRLYRARGHLRRALRHEVARCWMP